jgi:dipeptidyl aminopeptidase/acylaminoacyl peptidase
MLRIALVLLPLGAASAQKRAMTFADLSAVRVAGDPQVSPDGKVVLYAVRTTDLSANRRSGRTFAVAITGGALRAFPDDTTFASEARWSPDGKRVAFVARGALWVSDADGRSRRSLAQLWGGVTGAKWSPDGTRLMFTSRVFPSCATDACNADSSRKAEANPSKARTADRLMYRHWDTWDDGSRSHIFVVPSGGGPVRDLMPEARLEVPPAPFGGPEAYNWSPDGREIAFTAKAETANEAWVTDLNVYTVPADGGALTVITQANKGADQNPVYSPDGRFIAYASQRRAGFEADRWRLMLMNRTTRAAADLLPSWDRNADAFQFTDARSMLIETSDAGRTKLYRAMIPAAFGSPVPRGAVGIAASSAAPPALLVGEHNSSALSVATLAAADGSRSVAFVRDAIHLPPEIHVATLGISGVVGSRALSHENDALVAQLDMPAAEDYRFTGAGGASVHGFIVKPPGFDANKKWPVLLLIHGGPQGAWLDNWGSRWNFELFAATGVAVVAINPRGSTGYGQAFVDGVSKDWGGKVYTDLMNGLDAALARNTWMDSTRLGAAGGSFGGYMVNWIAGHNQRFKALATHAGVYNLEHMSGATEELWFTDWEFGGPMWNADALNTQYRRWSPHLSAGKFRTPTLVLHGERDFRVPFTEGVAMFTALQRQGVPSRFVEFPDEGHWILKPANAQVWWKEMQGWFRQYLAAPRQ